TLMTLYQAMKATPDRLPTRRPRWKELGPLGGLHGIAFVEPSLDGGKGAPKRGPVSSERGRFERRFSQEPDEELTEEQEKQRIQQALVECLDYDIPRLEAWRMLGKG
ncbi:unnamed protein product, partial [Effrenium voratum]